MSTIQLGAPGALRKYVVKARGDGLMWGRGPAQPFAAKVNSSDQYDQVDIWNEWVQEDWKGGIGRADPQAGGFLFAEAETRVSNQVILPTPPVVCSMLIPTSADYQHWAFSPGVAPSAYTTYPISVSDRVAVKVKGNNAGTTLNVGDISFYADMNVGASLFIYICADNAGNPGSFIKGVFQAASVLYPGAQWYRVPINASNIGVSTAAYWIIIRTDEGVGTLYGTANTPNMETRASSDGATWNATSFNPFFNVTVSLNASTDAWSVPNSIKKIVHADYTGDVFYIATTTKSSANKEGLWHLAGDNTVRWVNGGTNATPTDAIVVDDMVVVACGNDVSISPYAVNGETLLVSWFEYPKAKKLARYGGYLYRSVAENLYYIQNSNLDTANWIGPFQVCNAPFEIQSLAGMGGDLYMACDDGLYRFAPGEVVEQSARWAESANNGSCMIEFEGDLYIIVSGRVRRFTQDGSIQDVWVSRDDTLPSARLGEVVYLTSTETHLLALVKETNPNGRSSVWAFQDEAWHHLCTLPTASASTMYFDNTNNRLHIGANSGQIFYLNLPKIAINPYNDPTSRYMPNGWLQQDRFYGGQYLLNKSWESVFIIGDNLSTNVNLKVYFQDEGSTTWELLGTATSDGTELRWSTYSTRPKGKWVKIGVSLQTNSPTGTPRIRAIVTKFLPIVNDRLRDTLTLTLKDNITFPDATQDIYTLAQQWAHLFSTAVIKSTDPIIYQDLFGTKYETMVVDWNCNALLYNSDTGSGVVNEMEVTLVLEQVPDTTYTP